MFGLHIYTFVFVYVRSYAYEPLFLGYHVFSRLLIYIALNRFTLICSHDFLRSSNFLLFSIVRILQIPTQYGILFPFFSTSNTSDPSWLTNLYLFIQSYKHDIKLTDKYVVTSFRSAMSYTRFLFHVFFTF